MKMKLFFVSCFIFTNILVPQSHDIKNIILMISDGCGKNHIDVTSYYEYGELGMQEYDKFPIKLFMSTYSGQNRGYNTWLNWILINYCKYYFTDSAAAATAISTGNKTNKGYIGTNSKNNKLEHIAERANNNNKSIGLVTSVPFNHATPAGFVCHNDDRNNYGDLAIEMIYKSQLDLIYGCGNPWFDD
ncbi:MAG: alkaline phosphatase, partial [Candidatus Delongbacteria bacterium]|nr:alkaline phosphatase [Candidatus Delongbacteria bacterium]